MRSLLLTLFVFAALRGPQPAEAQGLTIGYNQGWIEGGWGHDLTDRFDATAWTRVLRRTRQGGGSVLRAWILEGKAKEGVVWSGHRPEGVDPRLLENLRTLSGLAEAEGVRIYWTLLNGNWAKHWAKGVEFERQFNVFNDKFGHGALFRERVLAPILRVLQERPQVNYGLDLLNEVQGSVRADVWPDGWAGAKRFVAVTSAFVHAQAPGLKVTASSGHHRASWDVLCGRFDGLGLDFYAVHVYSDSGTIPFAVFLARHARQRQLPLVIGEFGQASPHVDPTLQACVTAGVLEQAKRLGVSAVFAWRLEDEQAHDRRFSFYDGARPRPALNVMRAAAGLPPLDLHTGATPGLSGALGGTSPP